MKLSYKQKETLLEIYNQDPSEKLVRYGVQFIMYHMGTLRALINKKLVERVRMGDDNQCGWKINVTALGKQEINKILNEKI